ncbi:MAG: molybdopterin molybdotransferase MoeA [Myxococcota bacterium]|nr:molybdopterin molybdotransferase MoeA [Myxococcota bacterium]MDW8360998.1 molybdopterin molybdotransferase MoeA [Myxococcales bacterium]
MLSVAEALDRMMRGFAPLGPERVMLPVALGRFLANGIDARWDAPAFDDSAMDGWAVRAADLEAASAEAPVRLRVGATCRAGERQASHEPGTAARIFTGAPVPAGADAVVMQEHVQVDGEAVTFRAPIRPGVNVRPRGSDLRAGQRLLAPADRIGPGEIALLASQGIAVVDVVRRPVVAIVSTGDELVELGEPMRPAGVHASNGYALAALVEESGAIARCLPLARDDLGQIEQILRDAVCWADVVISSGGASVGEHDRIRGALERLGARLDFWKVAIKPGKPLIVAWLDKRPLIGLPGNPVSAFVTFEIFVRPCLRRMLGDPAPFAERILVRLAEPHRHGTGRPEFARARIERLDDGSYRARLHPRQGSGAVVSLAGTDALVVLPADRSELTVDDLLVAARIGGRGSTTSPYV